MSQLTPHLSPRCPPLTLVLPSSPAAPCTSAPPAVCVHGPGSHGEPSSPGWAPPASPPPLPCATCPRHRAARSRWRPLGARARWPHCCRGPWWCGWHTAPDGNKERRVTASAVQSHSHGVGLSTGASGALRLPPGARAQRWKQQQGRTSLCSPSTSLHY